MNSGLTASEIGPGDTLSINPYIYNSSTEEMYVFIKIKMSKHNGDFLYSFDVAENWTLVEEEDEGIVYAYGVEEPIKLVLGDETEELTDSITFANILNCEFYSLNDINISINGFAISADESYENVTKKGLDYGNISAMRVAKGAC